MLEKQSGRFSLADGTPLAITVGLFLLTAVVNWDYVGMDFRPPPGHGNAPIYLGPALLLTGLAFSLASCLFFHLLRKKGATAADPGWLRNALNAFFCVLCLLLGLAFILLGPSAVTLHEQLSQVSN